jgi:hypothetical protein
LTKFLKYSSLALALVLGTSASAHAESLWRILFGHHEPVHHQYLAPRAPEIDPALAISGITLVAGTTTVLRARRRKENGEGSASL